MQLCGKISSEKISNVLDGTVIMMRHPHHGVALMAREKFCMLTDTVNRLDPERAAMLARFVMGSAVEVDLAEEEIYLPGMFLSWMKAEEAEALYFARAEDTTWGDYVLGTEKNDGIRIPLVIEEENEMEEEEEDE